jgi:hypothetical protein
MRGVMMPTFTLELWRVLELYPDGGASGYACIGLDAYPIFDRANDGSSQYRPLLNQKIVDHFHNREIGQETVSMFKFAMRRKMNEIMPYYNQLYKSTQIEFDPLATVDMRTVVTGESTQTATAVGHTENSSDGEAGSRTVQSSMPQVMLAGNKDYATGGVDATSTSNNSATADENSNSTTDENTNSTTEMKGYQGAPAELINSYRASLLNIDLMVIEELREMFMRVWNTGDEYTTTKGMLYR